jgi:hypothetical protein
MPTILVYFGDVEYVLISYSLMDAKYSKNGGN